VKLKQYIFALIVLSITVFAQDGAWEPAGANTAYPRTILRSAELPDIRSSLGSGENLLLFQSVSANAFSEVPTGTSLAERIERSHIAKNAAFVNILGKKYEGGSIVDLSPEESQTLIDKVITILETFPADVDRITILNPGIYDSWQWRSKEMVDFSIAYDLLLGSGVDADSLNDAKSHLQEFAGNLYTESTRQIAPPIYPFSFFDLVFNNHTIMTAAAFGMAAIVINDAVSLDDAEKPLNWINTAMWTIENTHFLDAKRQSEPGVIGGFAEGPSYLRYGMLNFLPMMRAMGNFAPSGSLTYTHKGIPRSIPNPWSDDRYDYLFNWMAKIRMPDGMMPAIEDTYVALYFPELVQMKNPDYIWSNDYSRLRVASSLNSQLTFASTDSRANYIASLPVTGAGDAPLFEALPVSGNLIFRSGNDSNSVYLHATAKNGIARSSSYGHNQADVTSFLIYSSGQVLALDPGYVSYDNRGLTGNAVNHNMILVNGAGPLIGDPQFSNDADGFIENTFSHSALDYGETRTYYRETDITRSFLFVRKKYFLISDFVSSSSANNYTWQLHGYGIEGGNASAEGVFTGDFDNNQGVWTRNGVSLLAHTAAGGSDAVYSSAEALHELSYNVTEAHTVMNVTKNSVQSAGFVSFLYPYQSQELSAATLDIAGLSAVKISGDSYTDIAASQTGSALQTLGAAVTGLDEDLYSDASFTFFSVENSAGFEASQWMIKNGSDLRFGADQVMLADVSADIALQKISPTSFSGYVSKACTLTFYLNRTTISASGDSLDSWSNLSPSTLRMIFSGSSYFSFGTEQPLPVELISFAGNYDGKSALLSWITATELNNYGFEIERASANSLPGADGKSSPAKTWQKIGFVQGGGTSNIPREYQFTDLHIPSSDTVFYRLKQIDTDGGFEFSGIVEIYTGGLLPDKTILYPNYPNPFNPATRIKFSIGREAKVTLRIYDQLGRMVAELINERKNPGEYETILDGSDLASGVYFYELKADQFREVRKLMLVK